MANIVNEKYKVETKPSFNPYTYTFRHAIPEIVKIDEWDKKVNWLVFTQLVVSANVGKDNTGCYMVLFTDGKTDEHLVAFYKGIPYTIPRDYLENIMDLKPGQRIEEYLDSINFRYKKEVNEEIETKFFAFIASGMEEYELDSDKPEVARLDSKLQQGKRIRIFTGEHITISIGKDKHYFIEKKTHQKKENNLGGLLGDLDWFEPEIETWVIDPISAKTLLAYFYEGTIDMINEGERFLLDIMDYYPKPPKTGGKKGE